MTKTDPPSPDRLERNLNRLRLFAGYTPVKRKRLIQAWVLLAGVRLSLKWLPLPATLRWLKQVAGKPKGSESSAKAITIILWAIDVVNPFVSSATCLPRALTAKTLLARVGFETSLRIGVAKAADKLEAHAWLEHEGDIVIGDLDDLERYIPLPLEKAPPFR